MKLFEYQAKELFKNAGIPVPKGYVISSSDELGEVLESGSPPWVIKAQVLRGGRGKAGLIRFPTTMEEVGREVEDLFNVAPTIPKILLEEMLDIKQEIYLSITIDPELSSPVIIACPEGGMDIEEISRRFPEKIIREPVDIWRGLGEYQARDVMNKLGLGKETARSGARILSNMYHLFRDYDAELVEVNPLVITEHDGLVAADAKFNIDDNAQYRQGRFKKTRDHFDHDIEFRAFKNGLTYIHLQGDIGVMSAGAGLTMTVLDLIVQFGGSAANFLEFGGALYDRSREAMKITLSNPSVKVILITTFGLIARADVIAEGIIKAIKEFEPDIPIVAAVRGTGEQRAVEILREAGLEPHIDLEEAVKEAVYKARGGVI